MPPKSGPPEFARLRGYRAKRQHDLAGRHAGQEIEKIAAARVKTGDFIARLMMTYVGFAAFCVFTLLSPDRLMIEAKARLDMPFAGTVSFLAFMVVAPAVLIGMRLYLEVYLQRWRILDVQLDASSQPKTLSPLKHPLLRIFSGVALYFALPSLLIFFTWKAAAKEIWGPVFMWLTFACIVIQAYQLSRLHSRFGITVTTIFLGLILALAAWSVGATHRGLDLVREDMKNAYLPSVNLRNARADGIDLTSATLNFADLTDASFTGANFTDANLIGADFTRAGLTGANLTGAKLRGIRIPLLFTGVHWTRTRMKDADLRNTDLKGADFAYVDLTGTNFTGARNIPDLSQACANPENPPEGMPDDMQPISWEPCPPE